MAKSELDANEAYAFLGIVAPRLEQLRRRLTVANEHLTSGDPETARLNAILESQTAIREFLSGIPNLSPLVAPVDALLDAVREEPQSQPEPVADPEPEIEPEPISEPPPAPPPLEPQPVPKKDAEPPADAWLQIGTALALEKLTNAGMPQASAESHIEVLYASLGLTRANGAPITAETIRTWRSAFTSTRQARWRGAALIKRKPGVNPVAEARGRVAELATIFKKMAQLGASRA